MFYKAIVRNANGSAARSAYVNLENGLVLNLSSEGLQVSSISCPLNHPENQLTVLKNLETINLGEILTLVKPDIYEKALKEIPGKPEIKLEQILDEPTKIEKNKEEFKPLKTKKKVK